MSRHDIHAWKCDRPSAFQATRTSVSDAQIAGALESALREHFGTWHVAVQPAGGQGSHLTWHAIVDGHQLFVRVENGPEHDDHLAVESAILDRVRTVGVPTPQVIACDATRSRVTFAWQALERIPAPDLNHWFKAGTLDVPLIAFAIGAAIARWQGLAVEGFGVLDASLRGGRGTYAEYFLLNLDRHLGFLEDGGFLTAAEQTEIAVEIQHHEGLLAIDRGCLVHKDLALWNVLGTPHEILAFIDFDDSISGDPLDDLSLLACFHDTAFLKAALAGYTSLRPLPSDHGRRFWLHLLRNMIVKAVIRTGAGLFERDDGYFLIGNGSSGSDLRQFTQQRLRISLHGLREERSIDDL
jgi:aminoglycoside phosphotransferase (APT) family kinase protein